MELNVRRTVRCPRAVVEECRDMAAFAPQRPPSHPGEDRPTMSDIILSNLGAQIREHDAAEQIRPTLARVLLQ